MWNLSVMGISVATSNDATSLTTFLSSSVAAFWIKAFQ